MIKFKSVKQVFFSLKNNMWHIFIYFKALLVPFIIVASGKSLASSCL